MVTTKRSEQAERRRNQLVDAALDLFAERGIEATRISDIAQRAGVAQGLLYHYFSGKEALLQAIAERHSPLPLIRDILADPPDQPAQATLTDLAARAHGLMQERRRLIRLALRDILWRPESRAVLLSVRDMALSVVARYLQSRIEAGELRPHDTQVVAQTLLSAIIVSVVAELPFDPWVSGGIAVILAGVAAESAPT